MNELPGKVCVVEALSGLTIAEQFRDGDGNPVILFFVDIIFRFTQAGSEVSALYRMPSAVGYQIQRCHQPPGLTRKHYINKIQALSYSAFRCLATPTNLRMT